MTKSDHWPLIMGCQTEDCRFGVKTEMMKRLENRRSTQKSLSKSLTERNAAPQAFCMQST